MRQAFNSGYLAAGKSTISGAGLCFQPRYLAVPQDGINVCLEAIDFIRVLQHEGVCQRALKKAKMHPT